MAVTAKDIVKHLDGMSIQEAKHVLATAIGLLETTQFVSGQSPLLQALNEACCEPAQVPPLPTP
jgi:hypothetical protein